MQTAPYLVLDLWSHEGCEPPRHDLSPQCGVHDVESFQVFLVPVINDIIVILLKYNNYQ